jgi:uncharacterized MAPEG superfamily protein
VSSTNAGARGKRLRSFVDWSGSGSLTGPLSALSFWLAILLPVLYLPLLISGIESFRGLAVFVGIVGLHVLALIGGHPYADEARG